MTITPNKLVVLNYALWHLHRSLGLFSPEVVVDCPGSEPAILNETVSFLDDAAVIIDYTTSRISDPDRKSVLGEFVRVLVELDLLRLGESTVFSHEHIQMLEAVNYSVWNYNGNFSFLDDSEKWNQWWISLSKHPARDTLTEDELATLCCCFTDQTFTDISFDSTALAAAFMRFVLGAINSGVYPWDFNKDQGD